MLYSSSDIPVPIARLEQVERLGATASMLMIQGQYPAPIDPAVFQYAIHDCDLRSLHRGFIGEWHPHLRLDLDDWMALGPDADISRFESIFVSHLNTSVSGIPSWSYIISQTLTDKSLSRPQP
jgi:hypothetical protein